MTVSAVIACDLTFDSLSYVLLYNWSTSASKNSSLWSIQVNCISYINDSWLFLNHQFLYSASSKNTKSIDTNWQVLNLTVLSFARNPLDKWNKRYSTRKLVVCFDSFDNGFEVSTIHKISTSVRLKPVV